MLFIRLKDRDLLDRYHKKRLDTHGSLYIVNDPDKTSRVAYVHDDREVRRATLYEARSIATGVVCTLAPEYTEEYTDAVQEPC